MKQAIKSIVLLLALSVAVACEWRGRDSSTYSSAEIDISPDCVTGFTFGISFADQFKRYQTFVADAHQSLTSVEIKIQKNGSGIYSNVSVELYETDSNHQPSRLLTMAAIDAASIPISPEFAAVKAPLKYYGLISGKEYAIVVEQYAATGSNTGYEWCTKEVSTSYYFGKYDQGVWMDESTLGDGWLKVYVDNSSGTNPMPGSLDTSFGTDGIVETTMTYNIMNITGVTSVAIQADGKIVEAGISGGSSTVVNRYFALVRFNSDGSLDTSFGTSGKVTTSVGITSYANAVAIQSDGKIVAAGDYRSAKFNFALVRYNSDGSLDASFGTGGMVRTPIGTGDDYANAVAIQTDGKIVAAGCLGFVSGGCKDFALVRYNSDGSLDAGFGTGGKVTTPVGTSGTNYDEILAVAIQVDGKIVTAGYSTYAGNNTDFALVRYNNDGSLDTGFGIGGIVTTPIGTGNDRAYAVAIQVDGKIIAAGNTYNNSDWDFALVRYNNDGSLDAGFGTGGMVATPVGTGDDYAFAVTIQVDGKIVAAGSTLNGNERDFALVRYNTDGSLDTGFGSGGKVTTPAGGASAAVIQPDGKIVAAGASGSMNTFGIVRYWP